MSQVAPISCCIIVRNEAKHIHECLESIRPHVEEIVVVDTGSTDGTPDVARRYADKVEVFTACNDENGLIDDFSLARQKSFSLASQPWVMWADADDTVSGGEKLAELVAAHDVHERVCVIWPYEYDHDPAGNCTMRFYRERLFKPPANAKWVSPVHETCIPNGIEPLKIITEDVRNVHFRRRANKVVEPGRNLRILRKHYAKVGDTDARTLYYLGLETAWAGSLDESINFHKKYIELSGWDDEKYLAYVEIARHYQTQGNHKEAIDWALRASLAREDWSEAYFVIGRSYYYMAQVDGSRRNWERSVYYLRKFLEAPAPQTVLFVNPMDRAVAVHHFLVMAHMQLGQTQQALECCELALKVHPQDSNMLYNRSVCLKRIFRENSRHGAQQLVDMGELQPEAMTLIDAALAGKFRLKTDANGNAPPAQSTPVSAQAAPASAPAHRSGLDVVIFTGPGAERWNPGTIAAGGIGGSEIMAWEMARHLVALGNRVRVYGDCAGLEGDNFNGVEWHDHSAYRDLTCDVLITSRRPSAIDDPFNIKAKLRLCWVHDIHCGQELHYQRSLRIDRFLCLSAWHKDYFANAYSFIHPDQIIQTRNGIDLSLYENWRDDRNPHRMIYSSSPDRGLEVALRAMPSIRARVPDAELHVFYGFDVWKRFADEGQRKQIAMLEALIEEMRPFGVTAHGRVNQETLATAQMQSGVWFSPTWFTETSCLTAMQAHAAGMRIVTSPVAALNETVGDRGVMVGGQWGTPEYIEACADAAVRELTRPEDGDRERLREYAQANFGLPSLARNWVATFHRLIEETQRSPVIPYRTQFARAA
jgi:glycosyltransferase involved in cell wall biosynthesis